MVTAVREVLLQIIWRENEKKWRNKNNNTEEGRKSTFADNYKEHCHKKTFITAISLRAIVHRQRDSTRPNWCSSYRVSPSSFPSSTWTGNSPTTTMETRYRHGTELPITVIYYIIVYLYMVCVSVGLLYSYILKSAATVMPSIYQTNNIIPRYPIIIIIIIVAAGRMVLYIIMYYILYVAVLPRADVLYTEGIEKGAVTAGHNMTCTHCTPITLMTTYVIL